jgi:hypothetical protein
MRSNELVRRDPALAALIGASFGGSGADFGGQADFGSEFGDDMGADYGADYGAEYNGEDFGDDFGAAALAKPSPQAMARAYAQSRAMNARRRSRELMLNPNMNSTLKIEGYTFTVNIVDPATGADPIFGAPSALFGTNTPDVWVTPKRIAINVLGPGMVSVTNITVGNVNGTIGGRPDASIYATTAFGFPVSLPLMSPSTKATFNGAWSGVAFAPFAGGASFPLTMSLVGPATMVPRG